MPLTDVIGAAEAYAGYYAEDELTEGERDEAGAVAFAFLPSFVPIADNIAACTLFVDIRSGPRFGCVTAWDRDDGALDGPTWNSVTAMLDAVASAVETGTACDGLYPAVVDGELRWELEAGIGSSSGSPARSEPLVDKSMPLWQELEGRFETVLATLPRFSAEESDNGAVHWAEMVIKALKSIFGERIWTSPPDDIERLTLWTPLLAVRLPESPARVRPAFTELVSIADTCISQLDGNTRDA